VINIHVYGKRAGFFIIIIIFLFFFLLFFDVKQKQPVHGNKTLHRDRAREPHLQRYINITSVSFNTASVGVKSDRSRQIRLFSSLTSPYYGAR